MLFRGVKAKDIAKFQKVATEDAEQFKRSMQDLLVDVYACLVNFVGQRGTEEGIIGYLPLQYAEFADVGLEEDLKGLPKYSNYNLAITLTPKGVPLYQLLYNLSIIELEVLRKYLTRYILRGYI